MDDLAQQSHSAAGKGSSLVKPAATNLVAPPTTSLMTPTAAPGIVYYLPYPTGGFHGHANHALPFPQDERFHGHASHSLPFAQDEKDISPPAKKAKKKADSDKKSNKLWRPHHDDFLIPFLADQARNRGNGDKTFRRQTFETAAAALNSKFGENFTTDNIINHMRSLKTHFQDMSKCLNIPGAGWDEEKKMITVDNTSYESLIKKNHKMKDYLNTPLKYFDELRIIMGDHGATGEFRKDIYGNFGKLPSEEVDASGDSPKAINTETSDVENAQPKEGNSVLIGGPTEITPKSTGVKIGSSGIASGMKSNKRKSTKSHTQELDYMRQMIQKVGDVAHAIQNAHLIHWSEKLSKCVYAHEEFPDIVLDKAFESLYVDESQARLFIAKPPKAQKRWMHEFSIGLNIGVETPNVNGCSENAGVKEESDVSRMEAVVSSDEDVGDANDIVEL